MFTINAIPVKLSPIPTVPPSNPKTRTALGSKTLMLNGLPLMWSPSYCTDNCQTPAKGQRLKVINI